MCFFGIVDGVKMKCARAQATILRNDRPEKFGQVKPKDDTRDEMAASVFEEVWKDADERINARKVIDVLLNRTQACCIHLS